MNVFRSLVSEIPLKSEPIHRGMSIIMLWLLSKTAKSLTLQKPNVESQGVIMNVTAATTMISSFVGNYVHSHTRKYDNQRF